VIAAFLFFGDVKCGVNIFYLPTCFKSSVLFPNHKQRYSQFKPDKVCG